MSKDLTIGYVMAGRGDASRSLAKRIFALPFTAPLVLRTLAGMVTEVAPSVQHLGWDELLQGEVTWKFLEKVDLVFLSGLTTATYGMQRIAKKARYLGIPVVAGGSGVTCRYFGNPEVNLRELLHHYDAICVGRATPRIIAEIIEDYISGKLRYKMYTEQPDEPVSFTIPRHDLFRGRYFFNNVLQSSIGCSSACIFCVVYRCLPGGKRCVIYCVPPDVIDKQLEMFMAHGGGRFFDGADSFGENLKHTYEVVLPRYADYPGGWMAEAKVSVLKGDGKWTLLKAMGKSNNIVTYTGFEDLFNKFTSKQADISDIEEFIRVARGEGIIPVGSIILGAAPDAETGDVNRIIDWIHENKVDIQFSLISALESSPLWVKAVKEGTLIDVNPEHTDGAWPQVGHPHMSPEFLLKSLAKCYQECFSLPEIYSRLQARGFSKNSILGAVAGLGVHTSAKVWFKDHDYVYWLNHRELPDDSPCL